MSECTYIKHDVGTEQSNIAPSVIVADIEFRPKELIGSPARAELASASCVRIEQVTPLIGYVGRKIGCACTARGRL